MADPEVANQRNYQTLLTHLRDRVDEALGHLADAPDHDSVRKAVELLRRDCGD